MQVVEVRRDGGDVAGPMLRMRTWLDDHQVTPSLFRLDRDYFRLEFGAEVEANAFAAAFEGRVISAFEARAA